MSTDDNERDLERRLREALHQEAERVNPREKRTEILAMVNDETQVGEPGRRRLIPIAAAASVALIGAVMWGVSTTGNDPKVTPAVTSSKTASPSPDTSDSTVQVPLPNPNPNPAPSPTSIGKSAATTQVTLPAYFVGANSGTAKKFGLYREFVKAAVPVGATSGQQAKAAVAVAMNPQPFTNFEPYVQPWSGTFVKSVTVTPSLITITLSGPGSGSGFTAEQTRLAVQELVWTSQAAVGKGPVPVKFAVAGATRLFGTYPTARTYNRPAKDMQYEDLAPIWISTPVRGQVFPAGSPVVAKGESCAFEANTNWQLKKGSATIKSGFATATSGCPTRGTWQVKLGVLPAGSYTFRMYEVSMADGTSLVAETSKPFTVR